MLGPTSSINNFPNIFGIQSGLSMEQFAKTASVSGAQSAAKGNDTLTISSSANMLQQLLNTEMKSSADEMGELDMMGLTQLKQRGDMLASMLKLKMKSFESNLTSNVQGAGLPMQDMNIKNGEEGLQIMNDVPNKEAIQNAIGNLSGEFNDIARMAGVLDMLKQLGTDEMNSALSGIAGASSAAKYAQRSVPEQPAFKQSDEGFIMHISQSGTSTY